jgi:hypothetical protein
MDSGSLQANSQEAFVKHNQQVHMNLHHRLVQLHRVIQELLHW